MSRALGSLLQVVIMLMVMGPISSMVVTLSRNADTKPVQHGASLEELYTLLRGGRRCSSAGGLKV